MSPSKNCKHDSLKISLVALVMWLKLSLDAIHLYPSIPRPFARRLSLFLPLTNPGTLAHSSSTPVDSTTIQSRSTRHAASWVRVCSEVLLSLLHSSLLLLSFFSRISIWPPPSSYCTMFSPSLSNSRFFSFRLLLFRSSHRSLRKIMQFS